MSQSALVGKYIRPFIAFILDRIADTLYVVSFGAGVNSVAMIIELIERGAPLDVIIFADTGAEKPETIAYLQYFQKTYLDKHGYEVLTVKSTEGSLIEISKADHIIPRPASTKRRWCTLKSKIIPIKRASRKIMKDKKYHKVIQYIGFAADEPQRIQERKTRDPKYVEKCYPLVDLKITRRRCKEIIKDHGLFEPVKSGCFFCEFQTKADWQKLFDKHPELYEQAIQFEKQAYNRKTGKPEFFNFRNGAPISQEKMKKLFQGQFKIDDKKFSTCPQGCFDI